MTSIVPKLTEDVLELYADRVISTNGIERLYYYQEFETWYGRSGFEEIRRGRIFNYSEITEFLAILTVAHDQPNVTENNDKLDKVPQSNPLRTWSAEDWMGIRETLEGIQRSMLRADANAALDDEAFQEGGAEESSDNVNRERRDSRYFGEKYFEVLKRFTLHERLAPFRQTLDGGSGGGGTQQPRGGRPKFSTGKSRNDHGKMARSSSDGPLEVDDEFLEDFLEVMESEEDESVKTALGFLLEKDRKSFKPLKELQAILLDGRRPYSYDRLIERTDRLVQVWAEIVFDVPTLAGLYVHAEDKRMESRAMDRLHRSRARLDDSVIDPLPEMVAAAARAKRGLSQSSTHREDGNDEFYDAQEPPIQGTKRRRSRSRHGGRLLEPKKSAVQLAFTQEEEGDGDDIEESEDEEVLPSVERRPLHSRGNRPSLTSRKRTRSQQKKYEGKRSWTDDEKNAIKEGILMCGKGNWALIKERFSEILDLRTSGQIKDCVRTMQRLGELKDIGGEDEENDEAEGDEAQTS